MSDQEYKRQKAIAIADATVNAAMQMVQINKHPIKNAHLLKKLPFSDRSKGFRVRRKLKQQAKQALANRKIKISMAAILAASQLSVIASQPRPSYPKGS